MATLVTKNNLSKLRPLLETGSDAQTPRDLAKTIWAVNAICLFCITASIPYILIFVAMKKPQLALVAVLAIMIYLLCIEFNRRHLYIWAKALVFVALNSLAFVFSLLFGLGAGFHLFFFFLFELPFILCLKLNRTLLFLGCLLPLSLLLMTFHFADSPLLNVEAAWTNRVKSVSVLCCSFLVISVTYYLRRINDEVGMGLQNALERLQRETNLLQQILDSISDFVILEGPESELLWGNRAFREFYGMPDKDLTSLVDASFSAAVNGPMSHSSALIPETPHDRQSLESGRPVVIKEAVLTRRDGAQRWFNSVKSPLLRWDQKQYLRVAVCRDITEEKKKEDLIATQRSQMLASARLSALGEMAAGIAHEINNPLAIISGRSLNIKQLLQKDSDNKGKILAFIADIDDTSQRIAKIIRGLRTFAREGEEDPFVSSSLSDIIDDVLALCSTRFRNFGTDLIYDRQVAQGLRIECRPVQISQVLLNLLANAFDAVASQKEKWVSLTIKDRGDSVDIKIIDSGEGIAEENRERMFQPFFTTKELGKGTGLGLSISRSLVQNHKGSLELDDSEPHTCFRIRLPKRQEKIF